MNQNGGRKAKKGAKSNPFSSKRKASNSRRKGVVYFKRKGRTVKMKKKSKGKTRRKRRRKGSRRK